MGGCQGVARVFRIYLNIVARAFWLVVKMLLCGCLGECFFFRCCNAVAKLLLRC